MNTECKPCREESEKLFQEIPAAVCASCSNSKKPESKRSQLGKALLKKTGVQYIDFNENYYLKIS